MYLAGKSLRWCVRTEKKTVASCETKTNNKRPCECFFFFLDIFGFQFEYRYSIYFIFIMIEKVSKPAINVTPPPHKSSHTPPRSLEIFKVIVQLNFLSDTIKFVCCFRVTSYIDFLKVSFSLIKKNFSRGCFYDLSHFNTKNSFNVLSEATIIHSKHRFLLDV